MKKIIILKHGGGELANQLWNYISVFAYSLDRKYKLLNPAFFENMKYFAMDGLRSRHSDKTRKTALQRKIKRGIYGWYASVLEFIHKKNVVISGNHAFYLPPTQESSDLLYELENNQSDIYLDGWLFRNPVGIETYRAEIKEYFEPRQDIQETVEQTIKNLRNKYNKIIGVHIRHGDYESWRGGAYFISHERVREIIDEYISEFGLDKEKTCFLLASDSPIPEEKFSGLNIFISKNIAVTDLFLLASADLIIGSNSTFSTFASYYGNIPLIVMEKEKMDWEYYKDETKFFENKYSTFVNF